MNVFDTLIFSFVQGLCEFLPVSSSAHLIVVGKLIHFDHALSIDAMAHMGTLLSLLIYFRGELKAMIGACFSVIKTKQIPTQKQSPFFQMLFLGIATLPILVMGFLLKDAVENYTRSLLIMGISALVFGALMGFVDRAAPSQKSLETSNVWSLKSALVLGCAQVLAIIPGASRSGVTMTAARLLKMDHAQAFSWSFLLAIPTMMAVSGMIVLDIIKGKIVFSPAFFIVFALTALIGWGAIIFSRHIIVRFGLKPFAYYRIIFGLLLLTLVLA